MNTLRMILFNTLYYGLTAVLCFAYLPTLLLPRTVFVGCVRFYMRLVHGLEKYVLGLDYEVRGREHLPESPPYIVAAKHYSAYETLKLMLLFDDPAAILKRELLGIPLWGWYARKADMIAINRRNREEALKSIAEGSLRMKEQGRPIVIFPQGTRVALDDTPETRPYRQGVAHMYQATGLPIVPLALNSGIFWGRNAFTKRPGKVVFEFLPVIPPGLDSDEVMKRLEEGIEDASSRLVEESQKNNR